MAANGDGRRGERLGGIGDAEGVEAFGGGRGELGRGVGSAEDDLGAGCGGGDALGEVGGVSGSEGEPVGGGIVVGGGGIGGGRVCGGRGWAVEQDGEAGDWPAAASATGAEAEARGEGEAEAEAENWASMATDPERGLEQPISGSGRRTSWSEVFVSVMVTNRGAWPAAHGGGRDGDGEGGGRGQRLFRNWRGGRDCRGRYLGEERRGRGENGGSQAGSDEGQQATVHAGSLHPGARLEKGDAGGTRGRAWDKD